MARKISRTSNRQKAFTYLNKQLSRQRGEVVADLMKKLSIDRPYAKTLYQKHRSICIEDGRLKAVYDVHENTNDGVTSATIKKSYVPDATGKPKTEVQAFRRYEADVKKRLAEVKAKL